MIYDSDKPYQPRTLGAATAAELSKHGGDTDAAMASVMRRARIDCIRAQCLPIDNQEHHEALRRSMRCIAVARRLGWETV